MNSCELTCEWVLECEVGEAQRQRAAEAIRHLETCPQCAARAREYDQIRSTLQEGIDGVPQDGFSAMEKRLEAKALVSPQKRRFPWIALAASILLAAMGYGVGRFAMNSPDAKPIADSHTIPADPSKNERTITFSQSDMTQQAKAFDEVSNVFDHRATWLLVGDRTSDMGVSQQKISPRQGVLLMLQLTMLESGKVISKADLAILPGQSARLTVPASQGENLNYRITTSEGEPTRLAISTQLTTPGGTEALAALATTLNVEPGQKLSAGKMVTNSGAYELELAFGRADLNTGQ